MKQFAYPVISLFIITLFISSCSDSKNKFSYKKDGDIRFRNTGIEIRINPDMFVSLFYKNDVNPLNATGENNNARPSHFIVADGEEIKEFAVDYGQLKVETVETEFGKGRKLCIKGISETKKGIQIEKTLWVELYDKYPDVAIMTASYRNTGTSEIILEQSVSNYFLLDASTEDPQNNPYDFWSYQGASVAWGADYIIQIKDGFRQKNWMGVQPRQKTGGGVPFVDLWNKKTGLAIAHIETKPQMVSFPVAITTDKKVEMYIQKDVNKTIAPAESYETLKAAVIAHSLDYSVPLSTFSSLMADRGLKMEQPSEEAHEAIWCGWGYLTDFTLDDIYGTLPKLKELGINWVVIDDRWWDKYGDWNTRDHTFPGGEEQIKEFVDSLHNQGFKVKIWWAPTPVQPEWIPSWNGSVDPGIARVAKEHPEWLIMDKDGSFPRDSRDMYQFCPSVPEVQEYMKELTTRFIGEWGFDGHKLDAYYVVPPCYNPAHNHRHPEESYQDLPKLIQIIYETSKSLKPFSVTEVCNCGTTQDFYQSVHIDQPVVSDPLTVEQVRRRIKSMKALWGSNAPIFGDHVEHILIKDISNDKSVLPQAGQDFASVMGPGGVIGTKFTWPGGPKNMQLTPEREQHWQKWIKLYSEKELSKGDYLNLYDIIYDIPESHVIKKEANFYYAFYAENWQGNVELRGLENREYTIYDYVNQLDYGTVKGPVGVLNAAFKGHLLLECTPVE